MKHPHGLSQSNGQVLYEGFQRGNFLTVLWSPCHGEAFSIDLGGCFILGPHTTSTSKECDTVLFYCPHQCPTFLCGPTHACMIDPPVSRPKSIQLLIFFSCLSSDCDFLECIDTHSRCQCLGPRSWSFTYPLFSPLFKRNTFSFLPPLFFDIYYDSCIKLSKNVSPWHQWNPLLTFNMLHIMHMNNIKRLFTFIWPSQNCCFLIESCGKVCWFFKVPRGPIQTIQTYANCYCVPRFQWRLRSKVVTASIV